LRNKNSSGKNSISSEHLVPQNGHSFLKIKTVIKSHKTNTKKNEIVAKKISSRKVKIVLKIVFEK